jgi:hypothetical protein
MISNPVVIVTGTEVMEVKKCGLVAESRQHTKRTCPAQCCESDNSYRYPGVTASSSAVQPITAIGGKVWTRLYPNRKLTCSSFVAYTHAGEKNNIGHHNGLEMRQRHLSGNDHYLAKHGWIEYLTTLIMR